MTHITGEVRVKTCSKCKKTKKIDEFNRRKVSKDGYRGQCRACEYEYYRQYNLNMRDSAHIRDFLDEKSHENASKTAQCTRCGEVKPISEFSVDTRGVKGHRSACKACHNKWWQEYSAQFGGE